MFEVWAKDQIDDDRMLIELDSPNKAQELARRLEECGFTHSAWIERT